MTKVRFLFDWRSLGVRLSDGQNSELGAKRCRSLERRLSRLSERSSGQNYNYDFLSPKSSKNPILIPQLSKMNHYKVYGFNIQQNIRNISYRQHQSCMIHQQWHFSYFSNLEQQSPISIYFHESIYIYINN